MVSQNPTNCDRCGRLLGNGYVQFFSTDGQVTETICKRCDALERKQSYLKTDRLSIAVLGDYNDHPVQRVKTDIAKIEQAIHQFEQIVWYGGLQQYVGRASRKGHSMETPKVEAMLYAIAGRVMITFRNPSKDIDVTVITAETETRQGVMGLQSVDATAKQAVSLLEEFTSYVRSNGLSFHVNDEVNMGF